MEALSAAAPQPRGPPRRKPPPGRPPPWPPNQRQARILKGGDGGTSAQRDKSTVPRCSEPSFCFAPGAQATARTRTRHVAQGPLRLARCTKATMYNGNKKTKSAREKCGRGCSVHTPLDPNLYQNAQLFLFRNQSAFRRSVFVDGGVKCSTTVPLDRTSGK